MVDKVGLQDQTLHAAKEAREADLITQAQFNRVTDGTVSTKDVLLAKMILDKVMPNPYAGLLEALTHGDVKALAPDSDKIGLAKKLADAIETQFDAQSFGRTVVEDIKDRKVNVELELALKTAKSEAQQLKSLLDDADIAPALRQRLTKVADAVLDGNATQEHREELWKLSSLIDGNGALWLKGEDLRAAVINVLNARK